MAQSKETIKDQIINFYNDALFQKLNAYYGKTTLFNILRIERNENRHSAFLAWLLDVKGSHGLGEEPLKKFMRLLAKVDPKLDNPFLVGNYHVENMEVKTEQSIGDYNRRIDVYITFNYFEKEKTDETYRTCIIIENKVYTEEHDNQTQLYYNWATKVNENEDATITGVFLSPDKEKTCSCKEYIKIDYQDLLVQVIEPLLSLEMSDEVRMMILDYVINLGQPKKLVDEDGNEVIKEDTILAVSMENTDCFAKLYEKHKGLLNAALFVVCSDKKTDLERVFQSDYEIIKSKTPKDDSKLLRNFWEANKMLFKMVFDTVLSENDFGDDEKALAQYRESVSALLNLRSSNRNTKKYLFNGQTYSVKGRLCHAIVKYYVEQNPDITLESLQNVFNTDVRMIVATPEKALTIKNSDGKPGGDYYMKPEDRIAIKNGKVVVWSYWPERYFNPFKEKVKVLGCEVMESGAEQVQ